MLKQYLNRIVYAPVGARIVYDLTISVMVLVVVFGLFTLFAQKSLGIKEILLFPLLFVVCNLLIGMYGRHKTSSVLAKATLLTSSGLISFLFFLLMDTFSLPLTLSALFVVTLSIMPRAFLNFHAEHEKNKNLNYIIMDNAPILVVGGGGYIGTEVVEKLLKENRKVRVFDKFLYSKDVFTDLLRNKNLEIIEGDISNIYELTLALKNVRAVIHLAGIVGDSASSIDEKLTRHVNIISTRMLKETVKAFRIPKFIFASSCSVYGFSQKKVNEDSNLNPLSLYSKTKMDAERELLSDTFDEFHPTILRIATVFGHSRKPRFDLVVNLFAAQGFHKKLITVTNGKTWRPFVHVSDVAQAIVLILKTPQNKVSRQVFNVGDDILNYKIIDLAKLVKNALKKEKKVAIIVKKTNDDPRNYNVSFQKIRNVLDFNASITMEKGIFEIIENFKKGSYDKLYTDPYYSNLEMTKEIIKEFYSEDYQKTHFSTLS